jgi:hypothetical protein
VYFTNTFMIAYTTQQLSLPRWAGTSLVCVQALARRHAVAHGLEMSAAPARAQGQADLILPAYY